MAELNKELWETFPDFFIDSGAEHHVFGRCFVPYVTNRRIGRTSLIALNGHRVGGSDMTADLALAVPVIGEERALMVLKGGCVVDADDPGKTLGRTNAGMTAACQSRKGTRGT